MSSHDRINYLHEFISICESRKCLQNKVINAYIKLGESMQNKVLNGYTMSGKSMQTKVLNAYKMSSMRKHMKLGFKMTCNELYEVQK